MNRLADKRKAKLTKRVKRTARVVFANGASCSTTTNEFWSYIKRGFVRLVSEKPLTGEVLNDEEFRLVLVEHTLFRCDGREHLQEVLNAKHNFKRKKGYS